MVEVLIFIAIWIFVIVVLSCARISGEISRLEEKENEDNV